MVASSCMSINRTECRLGFKEVIFPDPLSGEYDVAYIGPVACHALL